MSCITRMEYQCFRILPDLPGYYHGTEELRKPALFSSRGLLDPEQRKD